MEVLKVKELERKIYDYVLSHKEDIIKDIMVLAAAESPTADKSHVDACGKVLASLYKDRLGAVSSFDAQHTSGDNLVTEVGEGEKRVLIVGHFDTVHPVGSVPLRREGNILYGPGVMDMKGGDIAAIWALKTLKDLNINVGKRVTIVNNSDEEVGSRNSKALLLEKAKGTCACIVAEPAQGKEGLIKVARKGNGTITIKCRGKASHAGSAPQDGVNANIELAHQIIFAQNLSDYSPGGSTFIPTIISGGKVHNVVPDYAEAKVDWRVCVVPEIERAKKIFAQRKAVLPGASVEFDITVGHPPMEDNEKNRSLFALLSQCADYLELKDIKASPMVGGCSDGNDISAAGIPTIDGMGMVGEFMHNPKEYIFLDKVPERVALMASFIYHL